MLIIFNLYFVLCKVCRREQHPDDDDEEAEEL